MSLMNPSPHARAPAESALQSPFLSSGTAQPDAVLQPVEASTTNAATAAVSVATAWPDTPLQLDEDPTALAAVSPVTAATLQPSVNTHLDPDSPQVITETAHSISHSVPVTMSVKDELVSGNVAVASADGTAAQSTAVPTPEPTPLPSDVSGSTGCNLPTQEQPTLGITLQPARLLCSKPRQSE